jgi:nucleoside-triphosphatase THEP1
MSGPNAGLLRTTTAPEELRDRGRRVGFAVESLSMSGRRAVLAHVDLPGPPRVGRFGVDPSVFEAVALPDLQAAHEGTVVVIDELNAVPTSSPSVSASRVATTCQISSSRGRLPHGGLTGSVLAGVVRNQLVALP